MTAGHWTFRPREDAAGRPPPGGLPSVAGEVVAVALLVALVAGLQGAWILAGQVRLTTPDFPIHARNAFHLWQAWARGDWSQFLTCSKYGPVGYLPAVFLFWVWGPNLKILLLSQLSWFALYGITLGCLGRTLYGPGSGFLACLYLFTLPVFVSMSRGYLLELPSQALVLVGLAVLVCAERLGRHVTAILFGVSLGLVAMTKPEALALWLIPLAGPAASALGHGWRTRSWREPLGSLGLVCLAAVLVCLPVLLVLEPGQVVVDRIQALVLGAQEPGYVFDPWFWIRLAARSSLRSGHLLLVAVGLVVGLVRGDGRDPTRRLVLSMLVWTFLIIHLGTSRCEYYLLNIAGCAALVATGWASAPRWRVGVAVLLVFFGVPVLVGWVVPSGLPGPGASRSTELTAWEALLPAPADPPGSDGRDFGGLFRDLRVRSPEGFDLEVSEHPSAAFCRDCLELHGQYSSIPGLQVVGPTGEPPVGAQRQPGRTASVRARYFVAMDRHHRFGGELRRFGVFPTPPVGAEWVGDYLVPFGETGPSGWIRVYSLEVPTARPARR